MGRLRAGWQERRGRWWWLAALILVPVVLASTLSVVLLLVLVDASAPADRIELIKTGLAIGAGTGGAVALVLAGRRQWSTELAHRVTEQSAADARHDAAERRITDLYTRAADQLGSDKAAVRLAGLYSLERLAQDTPPLRQTIVNLLCAYLRMPVDTLSTQEDEVRMATQRILATHLRPGEDPEHPLESFWPGIDLDLRKAVLHIFDLKGAHVRVARFGGARFAGWTRFDDAWFEETAHFGGIRVDRSASFRNVRFHAGAVFRGAEFAGPARFDGAHFGGEALFGGLRKLESGDVLDGASFAEGATFTGAVFARPPVFEHVRAAAPLVDAPGWHESVELD